MVRGDEDLVEEDLVELSLVRDLHQRSDLDAVRLHVDHEVRDPAMSWGVCVGAREADSPSGELRVARPDFLSRDQPAVIDRRRTGRERRKIGSGAGLAEQLTPDLAGVEDRWQPTPLLLVGTVGEQRRTGEVDADTVHRLQCARPRVFHVEDRDLHRRRAATAVLRRPVDADPTVGRELCLPLPSPLDLLLERGEARRELEVRAQPGPDVLGEALLLGTEAQIHAVLRARITDPRSARAGTPRTNRAARARHPA